MEIVSTLMQYVVSVLYAIILLSKFNIFHKILLIVGIYYVSQFNQNLNNYLQLTIKQKLPDKKLIEQKTKDGEKDIYGMPSGHAQYMAFFVVLLCLFYMKIKNSKLISGGVIYALFIITFILYVVEFFICIIYNYHTPLQYIAGTIVGGILSYITFFILVAIIGKKM
jgi:membrane-associated phospholipid phosphatase